MVTSIVKKECADLTKMNEFLKDSHMEVKYGGRKVVIERDGKTIKTDMNALVHLFEKNIANEREKLIKDDKHVIDYSAIRDIRAKLASLEGEKKTKFTTIRQFFGNKFLAKVLYGAKFNRHKIMDALNSVNFERAMVVPQSKAVIVRDARTVATSPRDLRTTTGSEPYSLELRKDFINLAKGLAKTHNFNLPPKFDFKLAFTDAVAFRQLERAIKQAMLALEKQKMNKTIAGADYEARLRNLGHGITTLRNLREVGKEVKYNENLKEAAEMFEDAETKYNATLKWIDEEQAKLNK